VRWATVFERMGARLWAGFAGVIIVEARKELMGALPKAVPAKGKREPVSATGATLSSRVADPASRSDGAGRGMRCGAGMG
jgi:hypothetical protein